MNCLGEPRELQLVQMNLLKVQIEQGSEVMNCLKGPRELQLVQMNLPKVKIERGSERDHAKFGSIGRGVTQNPLLRALRERGQGECEALVGITRSRLSGGGRPPGRGVGQEKRGAVKRPFGWLEVCCVRAG
jgi:hypothetical protein